jgi:hypothetical protein
MKMEPSGEEENADAVVFRGAETAGGELELLDGAVERFLGGIGEIGYLK